jgi:DNA-binding CsgD family transcriptional regulator/tetratricopeptide (TPR) repeat protein
MMRVLERDADLAVLHDAVRAAAGRHGSVVLVAGEAGIGKTTLVDRFLTAATGDRRGLRGACDDLLAPRPLGPFRDIARVAGGDLAAALVRGDQDEVYEAVLEALDHPLYTTVLLVEDIHWADDATLDLLRYVARRIHRRRGVLVLTYRDDELVATDPLQRLLGTLTDVPVHRIGLRPLSLPAVAELLGGGDLDPAVVQHLTGGNPFYVTELLEAPGASVPPTIVDAVHARLGRLSGSGRAAAEQVSIVPTALDRDLATRLVDVEALAEAEKHGVLEVTVDTIRFRHELARRAVEDLLPRIRQIQLHERLLDALVATDDPEPARVVHHAVRAGDIDRLVAYGPLAARDAAGAGAHRQALAHYAALLPHLDRFELADRAGLLEGHALESYFVGDGAQAVRSQQRASSLRRRLGEDLALGTNLVWLARHHWWNGDRAAAEEASAEAIDLLERHGAPGPELAMAYSRRAQLLMLAFDDAAAIPWAERAVALARELGDQHVLAHALCNLGSSLWQLGDETGEGVLRESLSVALSIGAAEDACRSYTNTLWAYHRAHRHDDAIRIGREAIAYAEDTEQTAFAAYLRGSLAMSLLDTGQLLEAERAAREVISSGVDYIGLMPALTVLGRVLSRRGEEEADATLQRAWRYAERSTELQRLGPAVVALAERAWLTATPEPLLEPLAQVQALAEQQGQQRQVDEIGYWRWKLGEPVQLASDSGWALQVRGEWAEAARWWGQREQPYERGLALSESDDPEALLEALGLFEELSAAPVARTVRTRLRDLGTRRIPRGPAAATRANPAGLTTRQLEVFELLAGGLTNRQIADRLVVSIRTVDHHVSTVLSKLGVATRQEAAARATATLDPLPHPSQHVPRHHEVRGDDAEPPDHGEPRGAGHPA